MRFLNQNNNSMDNIQKHFSVAALCTAFLFFTAFASFGQNVIYQCDFEDATENAEWTLANGSQTNQWYIGTAANNGGSNGLYITNDGGASNAYDNTSTSYVYAYREINFTENAWYNFELDWRGYGQYYYDIMNMFLIPTSVNPDLSAGNANGMEYSPYSTPSEWIVILGAQSEYQEWQHAFIEQEIEAGTYYLVLFWKNNNSYGDNPPAAIDNISITKNNCVSLSDVWVEDIESESATIVWEERGTATSWDIVISLDYLEDADLESADFITVTDMPYSLTGLEPLTYYYIYVRAACSNNEHSLWKSTSFETPRIPATLPYSFGFEDDTENANWELSDEADNLWAIGTAVSNGGEKGLYISENRGISNTYNNSKQSYAYAFRTINITEPDEYQFDFDWRANGGDSGYDLLRAFVIPTSLDPSISYGYHNDMYSNYNDAPSGWIDASADGLMSGQPRWQHSSKVLDLDAGTYYFVFFWKNSDGADGTNPPAAIDNISIQRVINPAVATFSVTGLNSTSATLHGNILSQGTSDITARGFEYGTDSENLSENTQSTDDTDEFSSTITGLAPNTTYYYRAYATNSEGTGYGTIKSFTTNGSYSGFDFVDLGLPSKTYWATMNIGATSTEDMGDYFAWGETTPKDTYEWSTYQYCNGSDESMTKYCNNPDFGDNGFTDNLTTLEASDDAATANWGSGWRMPIASEAEELYTYCSHVWTTQNGVTGRLFTGPNGRSIFLPGIYNGMSNHYWTNSLYSSYPSEATTLLFGSGTRAELGDYYRYDGLPVRAVYRMAPYLATVSQSNVTLSSATLSGLSYDNGNSDVIERGFQYGTNPDNLTETIQSELGANEFTATLTGLAPNTTYYYRAYATNSDDTGYGEIKSFRTPSGQLGDHYYVNLGLPSGTMWATCNVGGTNFEDLGNEYAWGETTTKDEYTQNNYTYSDNPATLPADADAAAVNWGEDWIMPTQEDIQELIDYCNTTWITINGIRGMQATSSNGNSIFIPTNIYEGYSTSGNYWSSSLYTDNPTSAMYMSLYSGDSESDSDVSIWDSERSNPARVRPVYKVAPTAFELGDEPYSCDFENADENAQWVLANGRQPSKWYIGTAASNGGANGLYISADDGAHNSYNFAEPSSTYAYRLINITTADLYQFDFDWRAAGNEDYDYLRAFLIPASIDPDLTPGAGYDPDWINICSTEIMSEQPEWQHSRTAVNIEETGMYYLAFFWENDDYYYGNNPSAAIDNISICKATNFFIDNRDGNIYSFVTIGDQTWLAENLRYAGNIQLGTEISETVPYLYYPDGNEYNVSTYGYLYNWPAAMNGEESSYETPSGVQGICPEGWHLPSEQEWVQLDDYLGRNNTGSMLAGYADSWFYGSLKQSEYFGATGFNALPAGVYSGTSIEFGHITRFWTTTTSVNNSDLIYHKDIISTYTTLYSDLNSKDFGNSVRCVRNTGSIAATLPYDCDFEDATENANWVLANGDETNKWYIGSATNNGGNNGLYISNDGGTTNAYTSTSESVVYAYRSIDIDENAFYEISFDWRSFGDVDNFDGILGVFMAPVSSDFDLSGGNNLTVLPDGWIVIAEEPLAGAPFWLNFSNTIYIDEGNYNLIFYWANEDNGGDLNPPAAIDNVSVTKVANPIVATSSVSDISATSATLHGSILSHGTSDITVRGFEYGTDEGNLTEIVQSTDGTNDFSVSLTNLASGTIYYYRAYATNSDDTGYGEILTFNTKICPDENMCGISYELADSYGDGWNGCAINVVDVETEIVIATLTIDNGSSATGTLEICDGREIIFEWVNGSYPDETSYQIFDANEDVIFSGTDALLESIPYTMSCPSCRIVTNFTIANITNESATISWTEQGTATSWELIVSETELDDDALEVSAPTAILTDPYYSAIGLTSITQYYVYVRSVCSDDDKSRWKKRAFVTTVCAPEYMCGISYELASEISIGWSGGAINIIDVESEIAIATLTIDQGYSATGIVDVCDGKEIRIDYTAGRYPDFVSYNIFDANGDVIDSYYGLDSPTSHSQLYTVSCPTCRPVKNIRATEITTESATIRWTDYGTAESWEIIVSDEEIDGNALDGNSAIVQSADSSFVATGLTSSTNYYVYVHALCLGNDESQWRSYSFTTTQIPASIPYTCDFEDADENSNWILANGNQTNQWHIGSAANNGGENGLYISDDGGTSNEYDINSPSVVYAYRTIDIDEDGIYKISFDWRSNGDGDNPSAFLGVFLAPVSSDFDLSGGNNLNNLPSGWIMITEEPLSDVTSWQNFTKIINIDEGSYNLIFGWLNRDSGGENPPAAIDNISINSLTLDISVDYPMDRSTTSADIKIHYTNLTLTENSLFFYYGTNRNNINYRVVPHYNSTNEYFYAEITNLEPDTKYYYYAEEISEFGTLLSDTLSFYTYGSFIDDRDNHQYSTIRIGNQIWMAEDLDYAGDIPQGTTETSSTEPYRYRASYCTEYWTYQYNWPAAMNLASSSNENPSGVQGVCPNGWHLPSEAEWQELYDTLGGSERDAGAQLVSGIYSDGKTIAESRYFCASGFNAIYSNGYDISYENAAFWSATASNTDEAYYHRIYSGTTDLLSGSIGKDYGFNVRCVKGTTYYTFDTIPYCGESYTFGTQTITESGDYTRIVNLGEDADSIYKLHITFFEIPVATISDFRNGCFGQNNGHATVSVEGGTAPYSYAWNTPEAQTGATLSNLAEGEYTVIVTDANGCSATSSVEITTPDEIAVSIADTACNSYEWNGTTYTETGEYTQTLHTAEGCDSVVTLRLTINHSSTGEFANLMCAGVPYTYGNETFNEAGTYTVTLTNSVGCDSIVTLTLTYADNCNGIISGVITDDYTGDFIPNARVTIGNNVTYTNAEGQYSLEVLRGRKTLRVSAVEYISHSEIIDVQGDTTINIALNSPRIITSDNISLTTYPYLEQTDTITITNTGNGTLVWSSITEYEGLALVEDSTIQRRNSRSLWDSIQTFATRENAEQAVVTDGFFIYTSSWMRPGEFNRYTPNGEYVETFFIENVGMIRNLSYNGNYFYGTDATNVILKLDLDNQTLLGSIETDIPEIRHCSFNRQDGSLLAGDWNSLYRIDTTSGTSQQIRSDLANVYSSAFDNLSAGGPYLWLFSQTSQDNGPSACIRQFDISANDFTDRIHYLDDIEISDASLAGGICASEYVCEGKFVLLANVQNPSGSNTIATYEIGRTNSVARAERKSGSIAPSESESIPVRASATETGEYASTIRYRAAVMGRQSNDVIVTISSIAPECDAVQRITATTDNSTITLEWSPVELGEYESVSYLVYNTSSQYAIDTLSGTSATYRGFPLGEHCFYVRALSSAGYTCLSDASDTVCAEIKASPCDIPLFVEARSDGETITVSWNTHADVGHFNIYKDGESIAENLTTTSFVDTDVVPETDYCYTVVAHLNNALCDEISETTCMRILTGVCTEAPVLTADAIGNSVILKWTECEGAVCYRIFRDDEFLGATNGTSYSDSPKFAGNYCYVVESDCEHRMYKLSNEECVSADAIAEWPADNITLYPNPTYGQFFIEGQHIAVVQIFNAIGQLVTEIENTEAEHITINCDGWNPGIYNIRIISVDGESATRKVTIFR